MSEYRTALERARSRFPAPELPYEDVLRRRDLKERHRRIAAGIVGVAVIAATIASFATLMRVEPATRIGEAEPIPRVTPPDALPIDASLITDADLRSIVFGVSCRGCDGGGPLADEPPSGTVRSSARGVEALRFAQPPQSLFVWPLERFEGALVTAFFDPPWGDQYVVSWGAVFVDAETASEVLEGYASDVEDTWGWSGLRRFDPRLGDEGVLLRGQPSALSVYDGTGSRVERPRTTFYLWRIDNLLLQVLAVGQYREGEIRSMAGAMTARARTTVMPQAELPAEGEETR